MKIHAPTILPPPAPPPPPPPARNDPQVASTKAPMPFDRALETKPDSDKPAQAGYRNRGNNGGAAARQLPAQTPASPPPAAMENAEAPVEARKAGPYAPGSIINIQA